MEGDKRKVISFDPHRIELSDGTVIECESGEFDEDIVKAIMEAGD